MLLLTWENDAEQDKEFFEKYLSSLVGEVFGEELMDKTKPDFYMVNFLRDDVLDDEGSLVEEAPKVGGAAETLSCWPRRLEERTYTCPCVTSQGQECGFPRLQTEEDTLDFCMKAEVFDRHTWTNILPRAE